MAVQSTSDESKLQSTIFVTGANRGLGLEFVKQYLATGSQVIASCRNPDAAAELKTLESQNDTLTVYEMDVADHEAIDRVTESLKGRPIDILLNNAGIFGPKRLAENDLRQSFGSIDYDIWAQLVRVNAMAPMKLAENLIPNLLAGKQRKIVSLTSFMGSITHAEAGVYAYRASKAALNITMAALANELAPQNMIVTMFNPGWVKTDMGGDEASVEIPDSISSLRHQIAGLTMANSGQFLDYDGSELPW